MQNFYSRSVLDALLRQKLDALDAVKAVFQIGYENPQTYGELTSNDREIFNETTALPPNCLYTRDSVILNKTFGVMEKGNVSPIGPALGTEMNSLPTMDHRSVRSKTWSISAFGVSKKVSGEVPIQVSLKPIDMGHDLAEGIHKFRGIFKEVALYSLTEPNTILGTEREAVLGPHTCADSGDTWSNCDNNVMFDVSTRAFWEQLDDISRVAYDSKGDLLRKHTHELLLLPYSKQRIAESFLKTEKNADGTTSSFFNSTKFGTIAFSDMEDTAVLWSKFNGRSEKINLWFSSLPQAGDLKLLPGNEFTPHMFYLRFWASRYLISPINLAGVKILK